jgi:hypothetical protein
LSTEEKEELWKSIPEWQREARSKGIPTLGSGRVYPFDEARIKCEVFTPPKHWPRVFGLDSDAGAGWTAIVWGAWDRDNHTVYITADYKSNSREKSVHIDRLRSQGLWIPGVGDAAGLLVTAHDSMQVIELYRQAGVDIDLPDKSVEAGVQACYDLFAANQLRIFESCTETLAEMRQYHRKDGKIVKVNDHLCDSFRYLIHSGLVRARVKPDDAPVEQPKYQYVLGQPGGSWMGS